MFEIEFFNKFVDKSLLERLNGVLNKPFARVTHKEAIDILLKANKPFENTPKHGRDLNTEHEKYLTDEYFKSPVFVDINAFPDFRSIANLSKHPLFSLNINVFLDFRFTANFSKHPLLFEY